MAPAGADAPLSERLSAAYHIHADALAALWRAPETGSFRDVISTEWLLPNGSVVTLVGSDQLLQVDIMSPRERELAELAEPPRWNPDAPRTGTGRQASGSRGVSLARTHPPWVRRKDST